MQGQTEVGLQLQQQALPQFYENSRRTISLPGVELQLQQQVLQ
jgi:hypothetical protein